MKASPTLWVVFVWGSVLTCCFSTTAFSQATLASDKYDYQPGTTATLIGTGFYPGETVSVRVGHTDATPDTGAEHQPWDVVADASGSFITTWHVCEDDCLGELLRATADGQSSLRHAEVFFWDATSWSLTITPTSTAVSVTQTYTFTATNTGTGNIGCITDTISSGFTPVGSPAIVSSSGKSWTISRSGNVITVTANSNPDRLITGETVVFTSDVTAPSSGAGSPFTWSSNAVANTNCSGASYPPPDGGQPAISISGCTPPTITGNPGNQTVCAGASASFSVTATGTSLTYQWRKNGTNISGATSSSYAISSAVTGDAGSYDVVVSGSCTPPDTSTAATLTVNTAPNITGNPGNQTVCVGLPASFTVTATGTSLTYQWRKNGTNISGATSNSYTFSSVVAGDAGSYDVIVSGTCTPPDTSIAATLTVNTAPNITGNPSNQTVCAGSPASFTVTATGTSLTYQWRKNGTNISGATSSSYTISSAVAGDAGSYDVIVSGTCTPPDTSTAATLTINTPPNITGNPGDQTVCVGSPAIFTVTATGTSLTYQWRKDGVNIGGATSSTYSLLSTLAGDAGSYDVIVSGACTPPDTSTAATLTVNTPPNITSNPGNQTLCVGLPGSFSVTATGTSLTYQWRKNGVAIGGATSSSYTISSVAAGDAGSYDVIVSGTCTPPDTSTAATLTVNTAPNITGNPGNQTVCTGASASFSVTATGTSLTYQWRKNGTTISGATSSSYTIGTVIAGDAGSYDVVVSGTCTPPDTSTAATLTVNTAPNITGNPGNQTVCTGASASFSVTAIGTSLTYQWRKDGVNIGGATSSTYSIPSALSGDAGSYDVIVSGTCTPPDTSTAATLTVNTAPNITGNPSNQTVCVGLPASFTVAATGTSLTYQWRKNGVAIGGATNSSYSIGSVVAGDAGSYDVIVSGTCTPPDTSSAATLTISTGVNITGNPTDQTVCVGSPASFTVTATGASLTFQWRKDGVTIGGATSSSYTISSVVAGDAGSYDVIVSSGCGAPDTTTAATLTVNTPPNITGNPGNQTVCVGSSAIFSVTATGTGVTYQWRKNGTNIGGATNSSYTISSVVAGDTGSYDVIVSGTCAPPDTSTSATLMINTPPNVTGNPGNQTVCVGLPASFSVTATGTSLTYQWRKNGVNIGGATSNTYSIASVAGGDAGSYDVIVSGTCTPPDTSTAATLTVNTSPNITGNPGNQTVCLGSSASFSVTATGTSLTYQWRKDGVNIGGATSSSYSISSVAVGDAGLYDVIVSGACTPSDTSTAATLTVNTPPNITGNPGNQTVCVGLPASFTVTATGTGLTYQWRKNGTNIGGATGSSYSIASVVGGDAGSYDVIVSGTCTPPDTSTTASLSISTGVNITGNPANQAVCIGSSAAFTVTATGASLTYQWRKNGIDIGGATGTSYALPSVVAGDAGSYDVIVSSGCGLPDTSTAATLTVDTPPSITGNPGDQAICTGSLASFSVTATGTSLTYQWRKNGIAIGGATSSMYSIPSAISGDAGSYDVIVSGTCTPPDTSTAATLTVNTPPNITGNPVDQTVCTSVPASFSVTATGTGSTYQWRKNGVDIGGATSSNYTIPSVVAGDAGSYDVIVSGSCTPPDTSTAATLTINTPPNVTGNPVDQTVCVGLPASFSVTATGTALTYQWRKDGVNIGGATSSSYTISSVVAGDVGSYDVVVGGICSPPDTSTAAILTISTGVNITGNPGNQTVCTGASASFSVTATGASLTYQWRKDGIAIGGATSSSYAISSVVAGDAGSYDVIVSSGCGLPDTSTAATLTVNTTPNITGNPGNQTVCAGFPASFTVMATGTSLTYQWRKDGSNISGATNSTYSIPSAISGDAGSYDVIVSGTCAPPDTSTAATLTINAPPNITGNPNNQTICVGLPASFTVTATGTSLTYQWRKNGVDIGGATSSSYTISSVVTGDAGSYDVIVSGTCTPPDTSTSATLTVSTAPNITGNPGNQTVCTGASASFSVSATGTSLTYQWRKDGVNIGGATNSTYSIPSALSGDAGSYDVIVSGTCTPPDTSAAAILTVNTPPNITGNPGSQTVCVGLPASFTVTATGTSLTYQWRKNGVNLSNGGSISGVTTAVLAINPTVAGDTGSYDVIINGSCMPPDTSTTAILSVGSGVSITGNPASQTVCTGSSASFSVTATGASLTYQWRKNGVNLPNGGSISGATTTTLTVNPVIAGDAGLYDVIVSSGCGLPDTSTAAALTVNALPNITGNPVHQTVCTGSLANFSVTATGTGLTYQWRKGGVNIGGATSSTYAIPSVSAGDAGSYDVIVIGTCTPPDTSTAATLTVSVPPSITNHPLSVSKVLSDAVTFTVSATGTGLTYQWRKNGVNIGGATSSSYLISSVVAGDSGLYDVIVANSCAVAETSDTALLTVLPAGQVQFLSNLTMTTNCPGPSQSIKSLYFGVHPVATYCIDTPLGENQLLPVPPAGTFDVRLVDSRTGGGACLGQGLLTDLRQYTSSSQIDTYKVALQPPSCGYPITIAWSNLTTRYTGPVTLRDTLGGAIVNVNMKIQTSYVLSDTTVRQLYVIAEQPVDASQFGRYRTFSQVDYSEKIRYWQKKYYIKGGDVRDETFMRKRWFQNGLYLGIPRLDSAKYGWIYWKRNVYRLPRFLPQTGPARYLDYYVTTRQPWHRSRYNPAAKYHENHLVAEQFVLKFNIGASDVEITPTGFGDLIFDDATLPGNPGNGKTIREIMAHTDTALTYGQRYPASYYIQLDSCLSRINRAFLGPVDTFRVFPMSVSGAKSLADVPYLHPGQFPSPVTAWSDVDYTELYANPTFSLSQNYPNPFNPTTTIQFSIAEEALVTLKVYNILGQEVATLLDKEEMADGVQEVEFNSQGLSSGIYFYQIVAVDPELLGRESVKFNVIKKMILLK